MTLQESQNNNFVMLAAEFETLKREIERTNDPTVRRALLTELALKLNELQRIAKSAIQELAEECRAD